MVEDIVVTYASTNSVLINGTSRKGGTFNIEVSTASKTKVRSASVYCSGDVYRWSSDNQFFIENVGDVHQTDAIQENIRCCFSKNSIGYSLDIARTLGTLSTNFFVLLVSDFCLDSFSLRK